jgi:hypothetical protein
MKLQFYNFHFQIFHLHIIQFIQKGTIPKLFTKFFISFYCVLLTKNQEAILLLFKYLKNQDFQILLNILIIIPN